MAMTDSGVPVSLNLESSVNNWQVFSDEAFLATEPIEIMHSDNQVWVNAGPNFVAYFDWLDSNRKVTEDLMPTHYRWRNPKKQSLDDALGLPAGVTPFTYPQTNFKPSSEAQLRADEEARISNKLSEKLSTISVTLNKITGKNFSVADIKLVKSLLLSVEEYEENR